MESKDIKVYDDKTLSDLFKDIVSNSENRRNQIDGLVSDMKVLVKNVQDAMLLVPLIKEYLDVGVKNDEHLVKLAAVVQRFVTSDKTDGPDSAAGILSEEEKKQLLNNIKRDVSEIKKNESSNNKELNRLEDKTKLIVGSIEECHTK